MRPIIVTRCAQLALAGAVLAASTTPARAEIIPPDRRIDWQPGIEGGIPDRTTICADVQADHGAVADGSTDDSGAFQAAIAACPEGQVVFIPAGTYRLDDSLLVEKGIVLRGEGPENTRLIFHGAATTSDRRYIHLGDLWDNNADFTAVSHVVISPTTLRRLAKMGKETWDLNPRGDAVAVVGIMDIAYGLSRMWKAYVSERSSQLGWATRAFSNPGCSRRVAEGKATHHARSGDHPRPQ